MTLNRTESSAHTREQLIRAAAETVLSEGYAATSARAIARRAGVNAALIFYHFGGVDALLLAALDHFGAERLDAFRAVVANARTLEDLAEAAHEIYRRDLEAGQLAFFAELTAAAIAKPELRKEIVIRAEPWLDFLEQTLDRVIGGSPLAKLLPPRDLAYAAITFYLGVNLFSVLDADRSRTEALFNLAKRVAPRTRLLTVRVPSRSSRARTRPGPRSGAAG